MSSVANSKPAVAGSSLPASTACRTRTWTTSSNASKLATECAHERDGPPRARIPERTARRYSRERDGPPFDPAMNVNDLLNPLAGLLVGTLVGFTGVGGGALMTPLLVFMFGVAPQTAVGTDL